MTAEFCMHPLIFDIARGSFVDGPGIRSVVFMKGCPLRCIWCHNPESQHPEPEMFFYPEHCIRCGNCENGCNSLAKRMIGEYYSPTDLAEILTRDKIYYDTSGGGVTFSGGEPLLFMDYLQEVSRILKSVNISIAVETCGYFEFAEFEAKLLPFIDLILFDLKIFDPKIHQKYTGKSNELILTNFKKLLHIPQIEMIPRTPLVSGITDTTENLSQLSNFLQKLNVKNHCLLPFNSAGVIKKNRLIGFETSKILSM